MAANACFRPWYVSNRPWEASLMEDSLSWCKKILIESLTLKGQLEMSVGMYKHFGFNEAAELVF